MIFVVASLALLYFVSLSQPSIGFTAVPDPRRLVGSVSSHPRRQEELWALQAAVGVFFGTSTGNTETAAELIVEQFGEGVAEGPIDVDTIKGSIAAEFAKHGALIVGTPTWNTGADTERSGTGWDEIYYGEMQEMKLEGKKVAVFGLGDSVSYAENYADASGELHDVFESLGCKMMGYVSQEGYEHESSKAIRGDLFCGLLLDAVNQEELTEGRIANWVTQLKGEGILDSSAASSPSPAAVAETAATPAPAPEEATVVEIFDSATGFPSKINGDVQKTIAQLEKENAELRRLMEVNSKLLDENIHRLGSDEFGYIPHANHKTGKTMWTSPDGRSAYFTTSPSKTVIKAQP